MKSRLIVAAVFVPLLFIVMFFLPPIGIGIVMAAVCALSAWELVSGVTPDAPFRVRICCAVSAGIMPLGEALGIGRVILPLAALLLVCILFAEAVLAYEREQPFEFGRLAMQVFAGAVMPALLTLIVSLRRMENGRLCCRSSRPSFPTAEPISPGCCWAGGRRSPTSPQRKRWRAAWAGSSPAFWSC